MATFVGDITWGGPKEAPPFVELASSMFDEMSFHAT
jgi:hypothetical protein